MSRASAVVQPEEISEEMEEADEWSWMRQCSKHLSHMEVRMMEEGYLGHEVVRQAMNKLDEFTPPPKGDWGYIMRHLHDIGVRSMRQLVKTYAVGYDQEKLQAFQMRAIHIVRLYLEEALTRSVAGAEDPMRKSSFLSLALTCHNFEEDTLGSGEAKRMGLFWTLNERNLSAIGELSKNDEASVEGLPSWVEAMSNYELRHEIFSLIAVKFAQGRVEMSQAEVRTICKANGRPLREDQVPHGLSGPSRFQHIFEDP